MLGKRLWTGDLSIHSLLPSILRGSAVPFGNHLWITVLKVRKYLPKWKLDWSFPSCYHPEQLFFLHRTSLGDLMGPPEFDIGLSTTYLIYGQALTWLGMDFVPLLPLISCVILAITFYIRRVTLAVNMSVSTNPWKANRTESFLHFFTFLSAIFTLLVFFLVISE